jgi:hypothetical protein
MTPEQIFDRLLERHEYLRPGRDADTLLYGGPHATASMVGHPCNCVVVAVLFPTSVACHVFVGGMVARGPFRLGERGKIHAYSDLATEESIERDRLHQIGTAIPGWDLPGLRWRFFACAPMSSTVVPFLGRRDQYLVCESPIEHMLAERRTLVAYQAHSSDISRIPQKETTK